MSANDLTDMIRPSLIAAFSGHDGDLSTAARGAGLRAMLGQSGHIAKVGDLAGAHRGREGAETMLKADGEIEPRHIDHAFVVEVGALPIHRALHRLDIDPVWSAPKSANSF